MRATSLIPISRPDLSGNEEKYVAEAVRSTWISSTGPFVDRFEREFAEACETRTAVGTSNGTTALHLALMALGVGAGDEVLVPSLTYIATANAVRYVGAEPVFGDVDPQTWCLDPRGLESRITPRTRGIIAVHLYGHPADMDALNQVADAHGLWVIEDAAEAHFARYKGRVVGSLSQIGSFSFFGNKILTCGEGGALTLNDPELEATIRLLRNQGADPQNRYFFPVTGYNFRLTNVACALLCAQMERREEIIRRRLQIFKAYEELLGNVPGIGFQPVADWATPAPWLFSITVDEREYGVSRDALMAQLAKEGFETRPFFLPLHRLPPFQQESRARIEHLPITDRLSASGMNLPSFPGLLDAEIERLCEVFRRLRR
ncbi:putative pyridoxal phosphate-dependent aminotransferase EpsN [compost metagenome]